MITRQTIRRYSLLIGLTAIALSLGMWLGTKLSENQIKKRLAEVPKSSFERSVDDRKELVGQWLEEVPLKHGSVPLVGRSFLELKVDGVYQEKVWLLAPDRTPLKGMYWATDGEWKLEDSELKLHQRATTGPTTRPLQTYGYFAWVENGELSMYSWQSQDRGSDEQHIYRRLLAKPITGADLKEARKESPNSPADE